MHGMGIRKGDEALKAWIDEWIIENVQNGTIPEYFKQVHGIDLPQGVLDTVQAAAKS